MTNDLQQARISVEVLDEYRRIAAWLEAQAAARGPVGDTMHGLAAEALTNLIEHEYSRHAAPAADAHLPTVEQIAEVAAKAWDEGRRAEKLAWEHAFDGHPVLEGEVCDECVVENPYRKAVKS